MVAIGWTHKRSWYRAAIPAMPFQIDTHFQSPQNIRYGIIFPLDFRNTENIAIWRGHGITYEALWKWTLLITWNDRKELIELSKLAPSLLKFGEWNCPGLADLLRLVLIFLEQSVSQCEFRQDLWLPMFASGILRSKTTNRLVDCWELEDSIKRLGPFS